MQRVRCIGIFFVADRTWPLKSTTLLLKRILLLTNDRTSSSMRIYIIKIITCSLRSIYIFSLVNLLNLSIYIRSFLFIIMITFFPRIIIIYLILKNILDFPIHIITYNHPLSLRTAIVFLQFRTIEVLEAFFLSELIG